MTFSEEQVIALAPDSSSVKSGKDLAVASKWRLQACSDKALWGECQGSGKLPYQTQIDLMNLAFKCSCPSRKFPCKHGLALMLLYVRDQKGFSIATQPEWVTQWLDKRIGQAEKKEEKKDKPVDPEAQARRSEARAKKVAAGIDDLQIWLKDLIRNGLLGVPERALDFWQNPAKRMVDAQAPGLASMLRGMSKVNFYGADWQYDLLSKLTRIYLASEAYRHINTQPEDWAEEIKSMIGFTQSKEELLLQEGVRDQWQVLARTYGEEEQLTIERNWLYGKKSGRYALLLQFFANTQVPELNLMPGTSVDAELVYYKGVRSLRAIMKAQLNVGTFAVPDFHHNFKTVFETFAEHTSANPFLETVPVLIKDVVFSKQNQQCYLTDANGDSFRVANAETRDIQLLAITGGKTCDMFLLANEKEFEPISIWTNHQYIIL